MCKNATATAGSIMTTERPTLVSLLTVLAVPAATQTEVLAAYDAADAALLAWTPGTTSTTVIEALNAAASIINAIPEVPPEAKGLVLVVIAGLDSVIAIVEANSPAPVQTPPPATPAEAASVQTLHAHAAAAAGEAKVAAAIGYKPSFITKTKIILGDHGAAGGQYKGQWNKAVAVAEKADAKYAPLKISDSGIGNALGEAFANR